MNTHIHPVPHEITLRLQQAYQDWQAFRITDNEYNAIIKDCEKEIMKPAPPERLGPDSVLCDAGEGG